MRHIHSSFLLLVIGFLLSGCVSTDSVLTPTWTEAQSPSPTFIPPTTKPTLQLTRTTSPTLPATLEPQQAKETIKTLFQDPVDCEAPCFWGIVPGQTTLDEAKNIFTHLGSQIKSTTLDNKEFYGIAYDLDNGLSIIVTLTVQDEVVTDMRVYITPETQKTGVPREWSAYSPETLIKRYGLPSRVGFSVDWGPRTFFDMVMYFDELDLIVEYAGNNIISGTNESPGVCPLTDQFDSVRVWMGKDPQYPPQNAIPLEKATSMTMEEFSKLMTGDPSKACFNLKGEMFP
jgi:hypothetical protein